MIDRSKEAVSNIERGVSLPGLDTIQTICDITKVPMTSIVEENNDDLPSTNLRAELNATFSHLSEHNKRLIVALAQVVASTE